MWGGGCSDGEQDARRGGAGYDWGMEWIQTFSGRKFFPLNPRATDLDIEDIAHALALNCRFNGHCRVFYSVAEHSVRVSRACAPADALWGLLHDAGEAYLTDLPRPVKEQLGAFGELEDRLLKVIMGHFGLGWPMPESVRVADDVLLMTEARDLMAKAPEAWSIRAEPLGGRIEAMTAGEAEQAYLARFAELAGRGKA